MRLILLGLAVFAATCGTYKSHIGPYQTAQADACEPSPEAFDDIIEDTLYCMREIKRSNPDIDIDEASRELVICLEAIND